MKTEILGVLVNRITWKEASDAFRVFLNDGKQHYIVTPNPEFIMSCQKDPGFKKIINNADLALPDGFGLKLASIFLGLPLNQKITGTDFINEICGAAVEQSKSIFLFGAWQGVAQKAATNLQKQFYGLRIAGTESGISLTDQSIIEKINHSNADILLVALGAPKQEKWIARNLPYLKTVKVAMGVGGAFDYFSGTVKRAPKFMRDLQLEWLFRLFAQPRRIGRINTATLIFSLKVIKFKLFNR